MADRRGKFGAALMARSIENTSRKDGLKWALRIGAPAGHPTLEGFYEDVLVEVTPRDVTTSEAQRYGKAELLGGYKLTLPGTISLVVTSFGTAVGDIKEEALVVRGDTYVVADLTADPKVTAHLEGQIDQFTVQHVHRIENRGIVQEYWLYVQSAEGGSTRGF